MMIALARAVVLKGSELAGFGPFAFQGEMMRELRAWRRMRNPNQIHPATVTAQQVRKAESSSIFMSGMGSCGIGMKG